MSSYRTGKVWSELNGKYSISDISYYMLMANFNFGPNWINEMKWNPIRSMDWNVEKCWFKWVNQLNDKNIWDKYSLTNDANKIYALCNVCTIVNGTVKPYESNGKKTVQAWNWFENVREMPNDTHHGLLSIFNQFFLFFLCVNQSANDGKYVEHNNKKTKPYT